MDRVCPQTPLVFGGDHGVTARRKAAFLREIGGRPSNRGPGGFSLKRELAFAAPALVLWARDSRSSSQACTWPGVRPRYSATSGTDQRWAPSAIHARAEVDQRMLLGMQGFVQELLSLRYPAHLALPGHVLRTRTDGRPCRRRRLSRTDEALLV